jgi:tetratricopeptide (TPR) repeat protein
MNAALSPRIRAARVRVLLVAGLCTVASAAWARESPPVPDRSVELPDVSTRPEIPSILGTDASKEDLQFWLHMRAGEIAQSSKRYNDAVKAYSDALLIRPRDAAALWARAWSHRLRSPNQGCPRAAIDDLAQLERVDEKAKWIEARPILVEWMAECGAEFEQRRWELARRVAAMPVKHPSRPHDIRLTLVGMSLANAQDARDESIRATIVTEARRELRRYNSEASRAKWPKDPMALFYRATLEWLSSELAESQASYEELLRLHPEFQTRNIVEQRLADIRLKREVEAFARNVVPPEQAERALQSARQEFARGNIISAKLEFERVVQLNPGYARGHKELGRLYARDRSSLPQAVASLKKAVLLDPSDYEAHELLGMVYLRDYPSEVEQARHELSQALALRPERADLHLHLGRLLLTTDREKAREHFQSFLLMVGEDHPNRQEAKDRLTSLERLPQESALPQLSGGEWQDSEMPAELRRVLARAAILGWRDGQWQEVEAELSAARITYPGQPAVLNALAGALPRPERIDEVLELWRESLKLEEKQVEIHEQLGRYADREAERLSHLRRAAELGSSWARFALSERLWQALSWWEASDELDAYLRNSTPYDLHLESAHALRERMDAFFMQLYLAIGVVGAIVLALPGAWFWFNWRGTDLSSLLWRSPKSYPDVAHVLSLIRHEVLKHNTAFLADVGQALIDDEPAAGQRAGLLCHRLFGLPGRNVVEVRSQVRLAIYDHFLSYIQDLEKIARGAGLRLNLRHKDPVFRAMIAAFARIAKTAGDLRRVELLSPRKRERVGRILIENAPALGRPALEAVGTMLARICVTRVDALSLADLATRISAEDEFAAADVAFPTISGEGATIRIFITDFETIVANVLRNSLASSLKYGEPPYRVAIEMQTEVDEITGLETLALRIKDCSTEPLTSEMLRGRYIERGMGITADLLARYDGSIAVEREVGWNKAVVLRFFVVNQAEDESASGPPSSRSRWEGKE